MSVEKRLLLGLVPEAEELLEEMLYGSSSTRGVLASVEEAGRLEPLAAETEANAVLVSPDLPGLTLDICARLRAHGLHLVGVALDERGERRLAALDLDRLLLLPITGDDLSDALEAESGAAVSASVGVATPGADAQQAITAPVVGFVGAKGAPGASACAASFAALAHRRWPTVLVELDLLGGGLEVCVGRGDGAASPGAVAEAVRRGAEPIPELLDRALAGSERGWPPVLLAPASSDDGLSALTGTGAVEALVRVVAARAHLIVLDIGWLLTEGAAGDAHRQALAVADRVVLVVGAREEQLAHGLAQLERLLAEVPHDQVRLVVNGLRGPGAACRSDLSDALDASLTGTDVAVDAWLPFDGRTVDRARRAGSPLAIARPRSRYARAVGRLLEDLFSPARPALAERRALVRVELAERAVT